MTPSLRRAFNTSWTEERYRDLLTRIETRVGAPVEFPLSETPIFVPRAWMDELAAIGVELVAQILDNPEAAAAATEAVPTRFRGPGAGRHPAFLQVDFGLVREPDGTIAPRLVELQAFASLYGFQLALADAYRAAFSLPDSLGVFLGGLDRQSYYTAVGETILGGHDPAEVVLMEIEPRRQKTWPDFAITEQMWGVRAIDTSEVVKQGQRLYYHRDGRRVRIRRIYNRVIPDELDRKGLRLPFDYRDDLDVEWAGHPAWFFRISKFSIPFLRHRVVPTTRFLHELDRLPDDREAWVLKPLFSFAGGGIRFAPSDADIAKIPAAERAQYVLQERVAFAPVVETPEGPTQAEIRVMYVWRPPGRPSSAPTPVLPLVRMGRGKMMGVDHNKGLRWVGASAAFLGGG
jgi:hypothetical protein